MSINVLAFNCFKTDVHGVTSTLLNHFVDGMKSAGADVQVLCTENLNIEQCKACTEDPNFESNGTCRITDDMQTIYPMLLKSDIWIFATPNSPYSINKNLLKLLDRLEPLFEPCISFTNGTTVKYKECTGKVALLSASDEWDITAFDNLIEHFDSTSILFGREFVGSVLRSHAWALNTNVLENKETTSILNSVYQAGKELIELGKFNDETLQKVNQELVSHKSILNQLNNIVAS